MSMLTQVFNTSFLGGRDKEDCGLRPGQTKKLARPILNIQAMYGGTELQPKLCRRWR
jgi:hypothetical protein